MRAIDAVLISLIIALLMGAGMSIGGIIGLLT